MKNRAGIISVFILVSIVVVIAVVGISMRSADSPGSTSPAVAAESDDKAPPSGDVEAAYNELNEQLQDLENKARSLRTPQERTDVLKQMDVLLSEFIDQYRGSPQAADKSFELGMVSVSLLNHKKAIRYLETFLNDSIEPARDKQAYAHFYLAESYKQIGEYDDAEAEYKTILAEFGQIDQRLTAIVQQNMAMLESERRLKVGAPPIEFEVTSIDGKKLSPDHYKGKVLLLDFWATWCAPCRREMPNVLKVYDKYNEKGFEIVGISLDRSREDFDRYVEQNNMTWPQYFDGKYWQNEVATLYGVKAIPATYLIDKKGKIRYKSLSGHQLEVAVKELLSE